jgi:hypothetical protein
MTYAKLIGETFEYRHPVAEFEKETRTLKIIGVGDWGGSAVVDCEVIAGRGTTAMVFIQELPEELRARAGVNS